ncbi:hypothetical protein G9C85_08260 [Halorubellus sp. JP-L1]|uniref:hypothetical protein n=1 Tax=Halorubellus sp. JP-L1 TaxID=2715753 RepID=UPI001409CC7B|nr:hypothetical protein [Halorubellus sp. JP-L1]NHN41627.1 hypothetical protein [Halorubellus sp. JP-L1]
MKRRALLKRASAVTGMAAFAGCLSEGAGSGDVETTEETGGDESTTGESSTTDSTTTEPTTTEAPVAVAKQSLETTNTGCGTENTAEIAFGKSGASVDGKISTSDPCHEAAFADVSLSDGALTVTLEAMATDAEACEQCLAVVEYSAGVETENGVPESVTVKHRAQGETSVVAEQSR